MLLTVPTVVLLLLHVNVVVKGLLYWSFAAAVNVWVPLIARVAVDGVTVMVVNTGAGAG